LVEAALFSSGKPLAVDEIAQATHLKPEEVTPALKELHKEYEARPGALEVVKSGTKWAMAVRAAYTEYTKMLAAAEIPRKVLRTLALIAFYQPIRQMDLKKMIGSVVYDHVGELHQRGMVTAREDGITKVLTTTDRFCEYFGIDAENRDDVRNVLAKRVGIDPAKLVKTPPVDQPPAPATAPPAEGASPTPDATVEATAPGS